MDAQLPGGLEVQWRSEPGVVCSGRPMVTWQNPGADVDQVNVRLSASPDPADDGQLLLDYWFHAGDAPTPAPGRVIRQFTAGQKSGRLPAGREQVGLDHAEHLEHQCRRRATDADVEPAVEEIFLVLHQPQLDQRRQRLPRDITDFHQAGEIHGNLKSGEDAN